nr:zf-HC2 domain-containing protein [Corynebacterium lactis]
MECDDVRAALSARLDGEKADIPDEVIDAHLSACADCRQWYERAVSVNRALSVGPASTSDFSAVDLSEQILLTLEPERRRRERAWNLVAGTARAVLIVLAVAWSAWAILTLADASSMLRASHELGVQWAAPVSGTVATVDPMEQGATLAVKLAAIRLALGVGMLWAAWRPRAAMGMAPVYGAIATFSIGFGIRDVIVGAHSVGDIAGLALMALSAVALAVVWLGGYTPTALAQAWRAASGLPVTGVPPQEK